MSKVPTAMTIAGSDSGAGAGIQADLKTFAALGTYGTSVITAVTAQNTYSVTEIHELPVEMVVAQIDAVMEDIGADAVKTGMLSSPQIIGAVAERMRALSMPNLVVDPVMVAKSGDRLLRKEATRSLIEDLLPWRRWSPRISRKPRPWSAIQWSRKKKSRRRLGISQVWARPVS